MTDSKKNFLFYGLNINLPIQIAEEPVTDIEVLLLQRKKYNTEQYDTRYTTQTIQHACTKRS